MKYAWLLFGIILIAGCTRNVATPPAVHAQPSNGCTLAAWVMQQQPHTTRTPEAPPPELRDTVITVNGTQHKISIPAGFTMAVFASIPNCRGLTLSPDGVVYATSYNGNVYALPDHSHNGAPDSTITVATGLGDPNGIGFVNGELYVSNNAAMYHLITPANSRISSSKVQIARFSANGSHTTRNFVFDSINQKLYVQVGSYGNMDTTDFAHRARIFQMNPDGSDTMTYATGLRNAEGMDLDPRTGALWVNMNGMDDLFGSGTELTANNPSEGIYLVCQGANYGWPWCYGFQIRNPVAPWVNLDTNIVKTFDGPVAEVLAHSAPLGLHFYRGTKFPALYHDAIFQCYHGSWDRTPPAPPRITVMFADTDGKNARVTDFVNGFQPDSTDNRWGRVVQIIEGADSALYVSDDGAGVIYRIAYTGVESDVAETSSTKIFTISEPVPNPSRQQLEVQITLSTPAPVQAALYDVLGNEVQSLIDSDLPSGNYPLLISTQGLAPGAYTLRVSSGVEVLSRRIVIER